MSNVEQLNVIGPALVLLGGAAVVLFADMLRQGRAPAWELSLLAALGAGVYAAVQALSDTRESAMSGAVVVDGFSLFVGLIVIVTTAIVILASREWSSDFDRAAEFYALILVSAGSMVVLGQAKDLVAIFVAIETTSISQFVLAGIARDERGSEAGLKYLLNGAIAAAVLLYGFAFLFGIAGTSSLDGIATFVAAENTGLELPLVLGFVLVAAGLGFKMAIVPFHAWVPDVYQGAPIPVASFLSVASKAAGFAVALRLFYAGLGGGGTFVSGEWAVMFGVFAAASMIFGNTGALMQRNVKRLLGYSSIAQAGNIAVGLAAVAAGSSLGPSGVLFFLATYVASNLGAFLTVLALSEKLGSDDISAYAGLMKRAPLVAIVLMVCLISLTGIPPAAGFIAKVYIFNAAIQADEPWLVALVAIAVMNTAVSAYYYMRWVRVMVMDEPEDESRVVIASPAQLSTGIAAVGVLALGIVPSPLLDAARTAAEDLL